MRNHNCSSHRRGMVVGVIMIIMLLVGVLVVSIGFMNTQTLRDVAHSTYVRQSYDTAQAGLQASVVRLKTEGNSGFWDGGGHHVFSAALPAHTDWTYEVTLTDNRDGLHSTASDGTTIPTGSIYASSVGSTPNGGSVAVGGTLRRITLFRAAAFVSDHLLVKGNSVTIDGKIGTSRTSPVPAPLPITLQSLSSVTGTIILPASVTDYTALIDAKGASAADINAKVDASVAGQPFPPITAPSGLPAYAGQTSPIPKGGGDLPSGKVYPNAVTVTNKNQVIKLHGGIYYFQGDVSFGGNAFIELQPDVTVDNPVKIYVDRTWDSSGCTIQGSTSDARLFQVFGSDSATSISLGGTADTGILAYIRNGLLTLSGSGHLFGSFVGRTVEMTGSGQITFDTKASQVYLEPAAWEVATWTHR